MAPGANAAVPAISAAWLKVQPVVTTRANAR